MSNQPKDSQAPSESHTSYSQRIALLKNDIVNLGERNMDNTIRVIRRWLNGDMRIINQHVIEEYNKKYNNPDFYKKQ